LTLPPPDWILVVIGGNSHPQLTQSICAVLGIPPAEVLLSKFAVREDSGDSPGRGSLAGGNGDEKL
jgi:hypothetical protein